MQISFCNLWLEVFASLIHILNTDKSWSKRQSSIRTNRLLQETHRNITRHSPQNKEYPAINPPSLLLRRVCPKITCTQLPSRVSMNQTKASLRETIRCLSSLPAARQWSTNSRGTWCKVKSSLCSPFHLFRSNNQPLILRRRSLLVRQASFKVKRTFPCPIEANNFLINSPYRWVSRLTWICRLLQSSGKKKPKQLKNSKLATLQST
jgi:hypothetical protein